MNHLYVCCICQVEIEALAKRRRIEIDTFIKVRAGGGGVPCLWPLGGTCGEPGTEEPCAVRLCLEDLSCGRTERPDVQALLSGGRVLEAQVPLLEQL